MPKNRTAYLDLETYSATISNASECFMSSSPVISYPHGQFQTGLPQGVSTWLPDRVYNQALDALVVACVDIIPIYRGRVLLGRRRWQPQADWWIFGGRMRKGELYQAAALRNTARELFSDTDAVTIESDRFQLVGVYNLIWDTRAQSPMDAGCHHISVTMMIRLNHLEVTSIHINEEYSEVKWILPEDIIAGTRLYHPCLIQMAKDARQLLTTPRR